MKKLLILGIIFLFGSCTTTLPPPVRPQSVPEVVGDWSEAGQGWWNKQVFYEVFVRGFQDSNGDGKGDLAGLTSRLDYLKELGVTALWLMPVFEAHSGHGYDTIDYLNIDKDYGDNQVFKEFIKQAHDRGIKVILDLVLNHTSDRNPWFKSQLENPQGPYKDYYFISDRPFPVKSREVDTPGGKKYFYGLFDATMPDLNYTNPKVTSQILGVTEFWLKEMGVDGYRLDAIKYLIEEGVETENTPASHQWLREHFFKTVKKTNPQGFTIGEVWDTLDSVRSYTGDQMDVCFNFPLSFSIAASISQQSGTKILDVLNQTLATFPPNQWGNFLRNHDQKRLMKEWEGDEARVRSAAGLLLTLPGIPFLYYGEEIGLSENRRAMQWDEGKPNWGFTTAKTVYINGTQEKTPGVSVSAQKGVQGSLFSYYQNMIKLRTSRTELQTGNTIVVETANPQVISFLRWDNHGASLVVANMSSLNQDAYGLTLWKGPLKLEARAMPLEPKGMGIKGTEFIDGGFVNWKPVETLAPWSVTVIGL